MEPNDTWKEAWNLEDYVIDLFKKKLTDTEEFKTLIRIFGRDKLAKIWLKYKNDIQMD